MKKRNMFRGANALIFRRARYLRENTTKAEMILWERLKGKKLEGFKFRRQHPIGNFIVDFYCHQAKLVVELDGEIHTYPTEKVYDLARDKHFVENGLRVTRFSNQDVRFRIDAVIEEIRSTLKG